MKIVSDNTNTKKKIAVVCGGNSGEFEISLQSGKNVADRLDHTLFDIYLIEMRGSTFTCNLNGKAYTINMNDFSLDVEGNQIRFDKVFICIHGNPGEDGRLQGYFDMIKQPYTGCNQTVSAVTFNKYHCNGLLKAYGIRVPKSVHLFKEEATHVQPQQEAEICTMGMPLFVKPTNSGSSVGMTKVNHPEELHAAILLAAEYGDVLIEEFVAGRELTCGVFNPNGEIIALPPTEVRSKKDFFDYEAKYDPTLSEEITPAPISASELNTCHTLAKKIYRLLGCNGVVRMDFIMNTKGEFCLLEVNTVPGQSANSIVPKQAAAAGYNISEFYAMLLQD